MITLNVEIEKLNQIQDELKLPSFPDIRKLEEFMHYLYGVEEIETNKFLNIADWLFSIIINHRELKTAIIYAHAHRTDKINTESYVSLSQQPFYHPQQSYFVNHAVSLVFSLSEKIAQLINVVEDINKNPDNVNLYNFTNKKVLDQTPKMKDSKFLEPLTTIAENRKLIRDIRHNKIHQAESELIRSTAQIKDGFIGDKQSKFVFLTIDELPVTLYETLIKSKEFYLLCTSKLNEIIKLIEDSLLNKYELYMEDFKEMGIYNVGMGLHSSFTDLVPE